jgi:molybdopterin-biosynthesis enzyme MoeA-like protein
VRRRARTDDNQASIVAALRKLGCEVADLSGVGDGLPDLLVLVKVGKRTRKMAAFISGPRLLLFEVKTARGKLRPQQQAFAAKGWPVQVVRSVDEAIDAVMLFGQSERA